MNMIRAVIVSLFVLISPCSVLGQRVPQAAPEPEPEYDGKSVSQWLKLLESKDPGERWKAAVALGRLRQSSPEVLRALANAIKDKEEYVAQIAVVAIEQMGTAAESILPELIDVFNTLESDKKSFMTSIFGHLGPKATTAVPAMMSLLDSPNQLVRGNTAVALGQIGPSAKKATPALRNALRDESPFVRAHASLALWRIGKDKDVIPVLIQVTQTSHEFGPRAAIHSLGEIGPDAKSAVPQLRKLLEDRKVMTVSAAAIALWKIEKYEPSIGVLGELVQSYDDRWSADALGDIGPEAKDAIPALLKGVQSRDEYLRDSAARALWRINRHEAAIPALIQRLREAQPIARSYAAKSLGAIGRDAKQAVPALTEALRDQDADVRHFARLALKKIDPEAAAKALERK